MTYVADILQFIQSIAPPELKVDGDNVGLLCGRKDKEVRKVLLALDPVTQVCREAAQMGADLLVTHHPLIFTPLSSVTDQTTTGHAVMTLLSHDIAAINAHTNLDCAEGGVNDTLAGVLGLDGISKVPGDGENLLRMGQVPQQGLSAFLPHVKNALQCAGLRYADGGRPVRKVAVGGGSCGFAMHTVLEAGCDTFVTADVKYNQFCDAQELGLNLIDAGHFCTENPVITVLAEKLKAQFPDIQVKIAETHDDCVKYY